MFGDLLDPEKQLKSLVKANLPKMKDDLCELIENLLLQVADQKEANPFELIFVLHKKGELAVGRVCDRDQNVLSEMDAGKLIKDLFLMQLKALPEMLQEMVTAEMKDDDINTMVLDTLQEKSLFTYYDENQELIFFEVDKGGATQVDLDEVLNNLEF